MVLKDSGLSILKLLLIVSSFPIKFVSCDTNYNEILRLWPPLYRDAFPVGYISSASLYTQSSRLYSFSRRFTSEKLFITHTYGIIKSFVSNLLLSSHYQNAGRAILYFLFLLMSYKVSMTRSKWRTPCYFRSRKGIYSHFTLLFAIYVMVLPTITICLAENHTESQLVIPNDNFLPSNNQSNEIKLPVDRSIYKESLSFIEKINENRPVERKKSSMMHNPNNRDNQFHPSKTKMYKFSKQSTSKSNSNLIFSSLSEPSSSFADRLKSNKYSESKMGDRNQSNITNMDDSEIEIQTSAANHSRRSENKEFKLLEEDPECSSSGELSEASKKLDKFNRTDLSGAERSRRNTEYYDYLDYSVDSEDFPSQFNSNSKGGGARRGRYQEASKSKLVNRMEFSKTLKEKIHNVSLYNAVKEEFEVKRVVAILGTNAYEETSGAFLHTIENINDRNIRQKIREYERFENEENKQKDGANPEGIVEPEYLLEMKKIIQTFFHKEIADIIEEIFYSFHNDTSISNPSAEAHSEDFSSHEEKEIPRRVYSMPKIQASSNLNAEPKSRSKMTFFLKKNGYQDAKEPSNNYAPNGRVDKEFDQFLNTFLSTRQNSALNLTDDSDIKALLHSAFVSQDIPAISKRNPNKTIFWEVMVLPSPTMDDLIITSQCYQTVNFAPDFGIVLASKAESFASSTLAVMLDIPTIHRDWKGYRDPHFEVSLFSSFTNLSFLFFLDPALLECLVANCGGKTL